MVCKGAAHPDERMARTIRRIVLAVLLMTLVASLLGTTAVRAQRGNDEVTLTIVGRAVDFQGEPVYDAEVAILLNRQTEAAAHGTSQLDGTFVVDLPQPALPLRGRRRVP